ncbi:MAG: AAA family ATPase [Rhizobiaceae bacterium]
MKGIEGQVQVWGVVGHFEEHVADSDGRETDGAAEVPELIGRDEEAGLLRRAWASIREEGRGQVVTISGEAGIGKSVLIDGLRAELRSEDTQSATFRCSPYHTSSTLYPMIAFLKQLARWRTEDAAETKLAKLERMLEQFEQPLSETVPLIATLMSLSVPENHYPAIELSPQQQKQMTQDALISMLLESAENKPLLTLWEDLHWADPSTLELLGLLIDQAPTGSLLILATARPEFIPPWAARSHITPITLSRLERAHAAALCARIAGNKLLPPEVVDHIVVKTDGVPLYVEELTKTIIGSDILQDAGDTFELSGPLESLSIPDTLQASLMARLDRLPQVREIAQLGSVLGREFAYQMILGLSNIRDVTLQEGLDQLVDAELLYQRGRPPRARYVFKHALVMDAAYSSLLRRPRQQYHRQVAELLEAKFPDVVEAHPELLAHHFSEAGEVSRAVDYWQTAGQQAIERSASPEAISHLDNAIEQIGSLPENDETALRELKLQTMLAGPLITTKGYGGQETQKVFARALELSNRVQDPNLIFPVLYQQWISNAIASKQEEAQKLAHQFLNLANKQSEALPRVLGHRITAVSLHVLGDQAAAKLEFEKAVELYDEDLHRDSTYRFGQNPKSASMAFIAATSFMLGYPDQSRSQTAAALAHAETINHVNTTAYVWYYCLIKLDYFRRDLTAAADSTAKLLAFAEEHGLALWHAYAGVQSGWVASMQGQHGKGVELARAGLAEIADTGTSLDQPFAMAQLGEVLAADGRDQEALEILDDAIAFVERTQERFIEVEIHRLKGQILASSEQVRDDAAAEKSLKMAMKVAKAQKVKIWELRTATSLAELYHRQGKSDKALRLLEPIYGWFTEGFDTSDLQNAKTLLASLRG